MAPTGEREKSLLAPAWSSVSLDRVSREKCHAQGLGFPGWPRRQLGILSALFRSAPSDLAFVRGAAFDFVFSVRPTTRVVRRALLPTHMYHLSRRRAPPPALKCPGGCSTTAQVVQSSPVYSVDITDTTAVKNCGRPLFRGFFETSALIRGGGVANLAKFSPFYTFYRILCAAKE